MLKMDFKRTSFKPQLSLITLCLIQFYSAHAEDAVYYNPRVTGQFLTGGNQQLGGFGDGMIPLFQTPGKMFFADGTVLLGQNQRIAYSGGLGYRQIKDTFMGPAILGAFGFVDYYRTTLNHQYTQINPGLEWLAETYEARLQGYIPASSRSIVFGDTFASAVPQNILFDSGRSTQGLAYGVGHRIIDTPVQLVEDFGPGVELELGRHVDFAKGMWVRAGGYHYSYKNSQEINGVQANLELAIKDSMSLILQDNYDDQNRNRFAVGLRVNFGGSTAPKNTLEHRMTTPIIRHAARQSYGEALPSRQSFVVSGPTYVSAENIWFFSPNGAYPVGAATTLANCTAEHPCSTINSATAAKIALIDPDAKFYFESGTYLIPQGSPRWANLQNGQTIWGRNTGWLTPAVGDARPLIQGGLVWGNQATNTIANGEAHNIRVLNNNQITPQSVFDYAVGGGVYGLAATGNLNVENSQIDTIATSNNISAVSIAANTARVENTVINATSNGIGNIDNPDDGPRTAADALGVFTVNQLTSLKDSIINAEATGNVSNNGRASAFGAYSQKSTLYVDHSTVNATSRGNVTTGAAIAQGLTNSTGKLVVRNNTIINANTYGSVNGSNTVNGFTSAVGVDSNQADVKDSTVTVSTHGDVINGQAIAFGVAGGTNAEGNIVIPGTAVVEHSTISVLSTGNAGQNAGVFVQGVRSSTILTVKTSDVKAIARGSAQDGGAANTTGIRAFDKATVIDSKVYAESFGNSNGSNTNSVGILGGNGVTSQHNTITARSHGEASNGGVAQALGIQGQNTTLVEHTDITVREFGNAMGNSSVNSLGILVQNGSQLTSKNNTITVRTDGNADSSAAQALGIQTTGNGNSMILENTVVDVLTEGTATNGGTVDAFGVLASTGTGAIQFQGTGASRVTAIATNGNESAAIAAGGITNSSTPASQCSTDGVNYSNC